MKYQVLFIIKWKYPPESTEHRLTAWMYHTVKSLKEAKRLRRKELRRNKGIVFISIVKGEYIDYGDIRGRRI